LLLLFIILDKNRLNAFLNPILLLFSVDLAFNVNSVLFGVDFFGRPSGLRPGDILPRLNGVFGNPMATVAIAISGIFLWTFAKQKMVSDNRSLRSFN